MGILGLAAIYPKRQLSQPAPDHQIHPYVLRHIVINSVNQVWSNDITYVRLQDGFDYLAAVIDWFSRFVLSGRSPTQSDAWLAAKFSLPEMIEAQGLEKWLADIGKELREGDIGPSRCGAC
jgi:transposase InsO family protein